MKIRDSDIYQRSGSKTGTTQRLQLLRHLGGQSLKVSTCIFLIADPINTHIHRFEKHINSTASQASQHSIYFIYLCDISHHWMISAICASQCATLSFLDARSWSSSSSCLFCAVNLSTNVQSWKIRFKDQREIVTQTDTQIDFISMLPLAKKNEEFIPCLFLQWVCGFPRSGDGVHVHTSLSGCPWSRPSQFVCDFRENKRSKVLKYIFWQDLLRN